jgi:acetyltransferase-like isoleucine patch superfamily enzyme
VEIGDFCTIVGLIIATNGPVRIGDHTFVAHEVVMAGSPFEVPRDGTPEPVSPAIEVGAGVWIGTRAVILGGSRVGADAVIGAGAVVSANVPDGATAVGNPASVVRDQWRA